jgi:DNA-binding response OmpR family regulator
MKFTIFIIDDSRDFLASMEESLCNDFKTHGFLEPEVALSQLDKISPDLILLDLNFPETDGFSVFRKIRKINDDVPVIFLTGDSLIASKVKGLTLGADDFLLKPISFYELQATIKNRIYKRRPDLKREIIRIQDLTVDVDTFEVFLRGEKIILTAKEFSLLLFLAKNKNKTLSRQLIYDEVWPGVFIGDNNLETHFSNLRKKLKGFQNITTIKNHGYILEDKDAL